MLFCPPVHSQKAAVARLAGPGRSPSLMSPVEGSSPSAWAVFCFLRPQRGAGLAVEQLGALNPRSRHAGAAA